MNTFILIINDFYIESLLLIFLGIAAIFLIDILISEYKYAKFLKKNKLID